MCDVTRFFCLSISVIIGLSGCAQFGPPPLETAPGHVPVPTDLTAHIRCELLPIVASIQPDKKTGKLFVQTILDNNAPVIDTPDTELRELSRSHPRLISILPFIVQYTFIDSVSLSLDVLDSQGFNPSLNFINPYDSKASAFAMFSVGANLTGSQDHNQTLNYTVNMAQMYKEYQANRLNLTDCATQPPGGIEGNLGLSRDVVNGLLSLDEAAATNLSSSSSPLIPTVSADIDPYEPLVFSRQTSDGLLGLDQIYLCLDGTITLTPPTSGASGNMTLSGKGVIVAKGKKCGSIKDPDYFFNASGSTFERGGLGDIPFSISGTLNREHIYGENGSRNFGVSPKITLTGSASVSANSLSAKFSYGSFTLDSATGKPTDASLHSDQSFVLEKLVLKAGPPKAGPLGALLAGNTTVGGSPGGTSGGGQGKASGAGGAGTTQFSLSENFLLGYGLNGGPTWTLTQFKGPAGSASLVSASRSDSDTLTMTFVAACRQFGGENFLRPKNYWQAIPICDPSGVFEAQAGLVGQNTNIYSFHR